MTCTTAAFDGFPEGTKGTIVPDALFDRLLTVLSWDQLKVMLYIIRRTRGFSKRADTISLTQFTEGITTKDGRRLDEGCGIKNRSRVSKTLKELEEGRYIEVARSEGKTGTISYGLRYASVPSVALATGDATVPSTRDASVPSSGDASVPSAGYASGPHNKQLAINSIQKTEQQKTVCVLPVAISTSQQVDASLTHTPISENISSLSDSQPKEAQQASVPPPSHGEISTVPKMVAIQASSPPSRQPKAERQEKPPASRKTGSEGISLTDKEREVYMWWCKINEELPRAYITASIKTTCVALVDRVFSPKDLKDLLEDTRLHNRGFDTIEFGNLRSRVKKWSESRPKPSLPPLSSSKLQDAVAEAEKLLAEWGLSCPVKAVPKGFIVYWGPNPGDEVLYANLEEFVSVLQYEQKKERSVI